jgi:hypothetical protein
MLTCILFLQFIIPSSTAQNLSSVSPNKGQLGQRLNVFITGQNVDFLTGSSFIQTEFKQGTTSITAPYVSVDPGGTILEVFLDLGNSSYPSGSYDLVVDAPAHSPLTLSNAFTIDTTALKKTIPDAAIIGQTLNVLIIGQSVDFSSITGAPSYIGGSYTINTTVVQTRGSDTLEVSLDLSNGTFYTGNYDLSLPTSGGNLILRNALQLTTSRIEGLVFYDLDSNGVQDPGENGMGNVRLQLLPNNVFARSNSNGEFRFSNLEVGNYSVVSLIPTGMAPSIADTQQVAITTPAHASIQFGMAVNDTSVLHNMSISMTNRRARCNGYIRYKMAVRNNGFASSSGTYYLIKDSVLTYYANAIQQADSVKGDTLFFHYNLSAGQSILKYVYCSIPGVSVLSPGALIRSKLVLNPMDNSGKVIPSRVIEYNHQAINRCSWDPNDITVSPKGIGAMGYVPTDTRLEYRIRFQNTGNDTAYRVVVLDTLSSLLDINTFEFMNASHPVVVEMDTNRIVSFTFDNIFLVDSTTNEEESHGQINFFISPKQGIADSSSIYNKAAIYFDFNPPVITNEVVNTFVANVVSIAEIENLLKASVYPNPNNGQMQIELEEVPKNAVLTLFNLQGQVVYQQQAIQDRLIKLDFRNHANGVYLLRLVDKEKSYSGRVVIQH